MDLSRLQLLACCLADTRPPCVFYSLSLPYLETIHADTVFSGYGTRAFECRVPSAGVARFRERYVCGLFYLVTVELTPEGKPIGTPFTLGSRQPPPPPQRKRTRSRCNKGCFHFTMAALPPIAVSAFDSFTLRLRISPDDITGARSSRT
jgi:hypothetical protein